MCSRVSELLDARLRRERHARNLMPREASVTSSGLVGIAEEWRERERVCVQRLLDLIQGRPDVVALDAHEEEGLQEVSQGTWTAGIVRALTMPVSFVRC